MRKLYYLLTCLLFTTLQSSVLLAANITWTGSSGGDWSNSSNWSTGSVPGAGDNVTFNTSVTATMNGNLTVSIASLNVTGNSNVVLSSNGAGLLVLSAAANALAIDNGSSLKILTIGINDLHVSLPAGAAGVINGTLTMEGTVDPTNWGASLTIDAAASLVVNGSVIMNPHSGIIQSSASTMTFNASSIYQHNRDAGEFPAATWDATSTINLTGTVELFPIFGSVGTSFGNLIINVTSLNNDQPYYSLPLLANTTIKGDFKILSTNGNPLVLFSNTSLSPNVITVNKNFVLSSSSPVEMAFADNSSEDFDFTLQVNGDFVQTSGNFSLQGNHYVTGVSKLGIKGNFNQTGGTFALTSASASAGNIFVVEFNGSTAQTITTNINYPTIDYDSNKVALRINNTSGGVSLVNALSVGRIDFQSGVLTTSVGNELKINSTDPASVNNPTVASYIAGPVIRKTNSATAYVFPIGGNGFYRPIIIVPNAATSSSYVANYFRAANASPVSNPLSNISNKEYWSVGRISGSDAAVQLSLNGVAVPGAIASSTVVVAGFDGTQWQSVLGSTGTSITPGDATSGTASSAVQSNFNLFTFGVIGGVPLPIILLDFTAKKNGSSANLKWKVDAVDIPQSVEVLKSTNGRDFAKIGTVAGIDGVTDYSYIDPLTSGNNYYRLRLIDKDGSIVMSKVAAIVNQANGFAITGFAPTLVTRNVKLNVSAASGGTMDLYIVDMSGKVWRKLGVQLSAGNNEQQLDLSDLSAGVYQVLGYMNGQKTDVIRFVKQ